MRQHNQVGGADLQARPWADDENPFEHMDDGELVEECYSLNAPYILANHDENDPLRSVYNFPVNNAILDEYIDRHMCEIHTNKQNTYKFQIGIGCILEHTDVNTRTGLDESRMVYFKPALNAYILDAPIIVNNQNAYLNAIQKLKDENLTEKVLNLKPNSKYTVKFITQVVYYVFNSGFLMGSTDIEVPDYLKNHQYIITRQLGSRNHLLSTSMCFFNSLAQHNALKKNVDNTTRTGLDIVGKVKTLYLKWSNFIRAGKSKDCADSACSAADFKGIHMDDIPYLEECFKISICIYSYTAEKTASLIYRPIVYQGDVLYLNIYLNHLMLITDIAAYCENFSCEECQRCFKTPSKLAQHSRICAQKTNFKYPGGYYVYHKTVFEELEEHSVFVPKEERFFKWFMVWDLESMLLPNNTNCENADAKIKYTQTHQAVSCSIASNVDGFREPVCIVNDNVDHLVTEMMQVFTNISSKVVVLARLKWGIYLSQLEEFIEAYIIERNNNTPTDSEQDDVPEDLYLKGMRKLVIKFQRYITQCPILSFNGANYDMQLIRGPFSRAMLKLASPSVIDNDIQAHLIHESFEEGMGDPKIIKRVNSYQCVQNNYFKFLDVSNYLAPYTSYSKFLSAMKVTEQKFFWPYEFLTCYDKLSQTFLPPYESVGWFSSVKNAHILDEEYQNWLVSHPNANADDMLSKPKTGLENYKIIENKRN